jgi:hypothetical protein
MPQQPLFLSHSYFYPDIRNIQALNFRKLSRLLPISKEKFKTLLDETHKQKITDHWGCRIYRLQSYRKILTTEQ